MAHTELLIAPVLSTMWAHLRHEKSSTIRIERVLARFKSHRQSQNPARLSHHHQGGSIRA